MHSFFLAFVFVLLVLPKLLNKFEQVSVFFSFGMEHLEERELVSLELKLRLEKLFDPPGGVVSIFMVCG